MLLVKKLLLSLALLFCAQNYVFAQDENSIQAPQKANHGLALKHTAGLVSILGAACYAFTLLKVNPVCAQHEENGIEEPQKTNDHGSAVKHTAGLASVLGATCYGADLLKVNLSDTAAFKIAVLLIANWLGSTGFRTMKSENYTNNEK